MDAQALRRVLYDLFKFNPKDFLVQGSGTGFMVSLARRAVAGIGPSVSGLSVSTGPAAGGTSVTITGSGVDNPVAVLFGGAVATINASTSTTVDVTSPAYVGPATVPVRVYTSGGVNAPSTLFTFT